MKVCTKCKIEKSFDLFHKNKNTRDGFCYHCKECVKYCQVQNKDRIYAKHREWNFKNKDIVIKNSRQYRHDNKEEIKNQRKDYYSINKDYISEYGKKWYSLNKTYAAEKNRKYLSDNKESISEYKKKYNLLKPEVGHNCRARRRYNIGNNKLSIGIIAKIYKQQKGLCICCKEPLGDDYHLDHIMPLALGGSHTDDNIQLLKSFCNMSKNKKHPIDFMQEKGYLL